MRISQIIEGVLAKNLQATLLFVGFSKTFGSIHRGKIEKIVLAYGISKETGTAIMRLYKNTKAMVRSPDGDAHFFDIVFRVLQGDTFAQYLLILCQDYILRTSIYLIKENGFTLKKARSWRYPEKKQTTMTDADYADDLALPLNTSAQAEFQLHSLEQSAGVIICYVNANETKYMCCKQKGTISILSGLLLKLVDQFTYLGSNISSTESDVSIRLAKAWNAIDRLSI